MNFDFWSFLVSFILFGSMLLVFVSTYLNHTWMRKRKFEEVEKAKAKGEEVDMNKVRLNVAEFSGREKFVRCFSLHRNLRRLLKPTNYDPDDSEFEIFNAIKVYSIAVIIVGNTYFYTLSGPLRNLDVINDWFSSFSFLWVI